MRLPKCPACPSTTFENHPTQLNGYRFPVNFVQCARCGVVVGVLPYWDAGYLANENWKSLEKVKSDVAHLMAVAV